MNLDIPDVATDARQTAAAVLGSAGGVELARECEADPRQRERASGLLDELGIDDLDPRDGVDEAMVAAALCREAGANALPYPVVARLLGTDGVLLGIAPAGSTVRINHGDLGEWEVTDLSGRVHAAVAGDAMGQPLAPFVANAIRASSRAYRPMSDSALWIVLDSWLVLGGIERALTLAAEYLPDRRQFGRPLSSFQGLRFRVADLAVSLRGVEELAKFTTWAHFSRSEDALMDALALRVACQEAAKTIFQNSHLLHGAIGFCDEHDLSVLNRHLQPNIRMPWDLEATSAALVEQIRSRGLNTLFGRFGRSGPVTTEERNPR